MAGPPAATGTDHPAAARHPPRRAVAVDGKTLRGSGHHPRLPVHLLAAMDHTSCAVLAQTEVYGKTNEITRFRPLLDRLDLTDTVVTADALHTQREHAEWLVTHRHAAYVLIVKANQPALHRQLKLLPWHQVPVADHTATAAMAGWRPAASRSPPSPAWTSPTPPRPCGSPARSARSTSYAGGP
jgi:Transposase DDE domain